METPYSVQAAGPSQPKLLKTSLSVDNLDNTVWLAKWEQTILPISVPVPILKRRNGGRVQTPGSGTKRARFDPVNLCSVKFFDTVKSTPNLLIRQPEDHDLHWKGTGHVGRSTPNLMAPDTVRPPASWTDFLTLAPANSLPNVSGQFPAHPHVRCPFHLDLAGMSGGGARKSEKMFQFLKELEGKKKQRAPVHSTLFRPRNIHSFTLPAQIPTTPSRGVETATTDKAVVEFLRKYRCDNPPSSVLAQTTTSDDFFKWTRFIFAQQIMTYAKRVVFLRREGAAQMKRDAAIKFVMGVSMTIGMKPPLRRNDLLNPCALFSKKRTIKFLGLLVDFVKEKRETEWKKLVPRLA